MSTYKLGDIVIIKKGRKVEDTLDVYIEESKRFIQIDDLRNNNKVKYTKSDGIFASENDVLIAWDGANAGTVGYGLTGVIGSTIASLEIDNDQFIGSFIGKCLQSKFHLIRKNCTGATIPHIRRDYLLNIKIPKIDKKKQKQIVQILDTADTFRQKRQEQLKLLDDYLKSVFFEMFGDPVRNEKKWEIKKLEDVCLKITDGTHQPPKFSPKGIPFIFISNIVENEIILQTKKYITEETYHELTNTTPIEVKDILYTTVGSYGNPAIVKTQEKFCFQRHIAQLKPNHRKINYIYLFETLKSPMIKNQADCKVRGIAQKTLNLGDLKNFNIFLPPKEKQEDFAKIIQRVEQTKQKMRASLDEMDNHFNALMQRYFG